jgi:HSP20 family protein
MAKKPSFFEKLTGASWSESNKEEKEEKIEVDKKKNKKKKLIKKNLVAEKSAPEEIIAESEGQLTIDVYQTPNEIVIRSTIAGVRPEDIDISMVDDMITIKGTRKKDQDIPEKDYYYQECYWGQFSRSVILPIDVEPGKVKATMKNGILTIKLPKAEKSKAKKIQIVEE